MFTKKSQGFTLIELLLVIAIIGILAGVILAVINPQAQQRKAQEGVAASAVSKACLAVAGCNSASVSGVCANPLGEVQNFTTAQLTFLSAAPTVNSGAVSVNTSWNCLISCDTATGTITRGANCLTR